MKTIDIHNKELIDFLNENKHIDIEKLLINLIPFLSSCKNTQYTDIEKLLAETNEKQQKICDYTKTFIREQLKDQTSLIQIAVMEQIKNANAIPEIHQKIHEITYKFQQSVLQYIQPLQQNINYNTTNISNLHECITNFTNQFQNSSKKGNISEQFLKNVLTNAFPNTEIKSTSKTSKSGDFILEHCIGSILIENKDYSENVPKDEVNKFIRDVQENNTHGILLSQKTGIVNKENFHIDVNNGKAIIYLHNVNYDASLIQIAVSIIQSIDPFVKGTISEASCSLSKEQVKQIYNEWIENENHKNEIIENLQLQIKKIKTFKCFPSIKTFLETKFPMTNERLVCQFCQKNFGNKGGLAQHLRYCLFKPKDVMEEDT